MTQQWISPEVNVKGLKKYCISNAVDLMDYDTLWNGSEEDRKVRSECKEDEGTAVKMKALTVKMETMTLIGIGRMNLTCFLY